MSEYKNVYKFDITERGGVSEELKKAFISYCKRKKYHLLVEEGGVGYKGHYHLHGIVGSNYSCVRNFRKKEIKPIYFESNKLECFTAIAVRTKCVKPEHLTGGLSYIYKEKRVLTVSGISLKEIPLWKQKQEIPNCSRLRTKTHVSSSQLVNSVVSYIDKNGVLNPKCYFDVRNIMEDMTRQGYLFKLDNKMRSRVGTILQCYDCPSYMLSHLDSLCNFYA